MAKRIKKKPKKIYKVFSSLLVFISIVLIMSLIYFNILPFIYQIVVIFLIVMLDFILVLLMLKSKKRRIASLISSIVIIVMACFSFYVLKTAGLLNNLNLSYKTYNYSVVVLKESGYEEISDLQDSELGFYESDGDECDKSLEKLSKKIDIVNKGYDDINDLTHDLLDNKIDAILIEDSYLEILSENDGSDSEIENFSDNTYVIYKFSIMLKTSDISKDLDVTKESFNIYVSGIDTYGEISSVSRSDVNMVVTVNPGTRQILLTSIPRDYYVPLHGKSGYNDKITHAGLYGTDMSIQTIEDLLDIEINYYVKVNFTSVIEIVDAIDGVNVYSDYDFTSIDGYRYTKGYNDVNGEEALSFARERKAFALGDRQRVKDQQALLEAIFRKCTSTAVITKYNSLLNSIEGSFVTNMPTDRLTSLIKMQLSKMYKWTITSNSLSGEDSSNYTYSYPSQKLYVMETIDESVDYASELILSVMEGRKLDYVYDGNDADSNKVTNSSSSKSNKKEETKNNNTNDNVDTKKETSDNEGLKVSLGRTSVTMNSGEDFIYYGYSATYNGKDVTDDTSVLFSINGNTFDDYHDLIGYITNDLSVGEYNIVYSVQYNGNSKIFNQSVIIKDNPVLDDEIVSDNDDIDNSLNEDIDSSLNDDTDGADSSLIDEE